jgi:hypothetical protein
MMLAVFALREDIVKSVLNNKALVREDITTRKLVLKPCTIVKSVTLVSTVLVKLQQVCQENVPPVTIVFKAIQREVLPFQINTLLNLEPTRSMMELMIHFQKLL